MTMNSSAVQPGAGASKPCRNHFQGFPETEETCRWFAWLIELNDAYEPYHGVICVVICTFGIITNVLNAVVLTRRTMCSPFNTILTAVALCNIGTMASYLLYVCYFLQWTDSASDQDYILAQYSYGWMVFAVVHMIISNTLHSTSLWLTIILAVVRVLRFMARPSGCARRLKNCCFSPRNTARMCLAVYVIVQLLCVPMMLSNAVVELPAHEAWTNVSGPWFNSSYSSKEYNVEVVNWPMLKASLWLVGVLFKVIPCLLLALFIGILNHMLHHAKRRRLTITSMRENLKCTSIRNYDRISCMLTIILSVFLVTELPQGIASVLSAIYPGDFQTYLYKNFGNFLDLLSLVNSSVNFILYCAMSHKFRKHFLEVVLPKAIWTKVSFSSYSYPEE